MAGGDEFIGGGGGQGALAAVLFIGAGTNVYDAFSAVMSSPWSTEKFTKDSEEERMARQYVTHAMAISWAYALGGAYLSRSPWPVAGAVLATVYMYWLYNRALNRSQSSDGMSAQPPDVAGGY
ncbi:MAG TPA: hypothetical protein VF032_19485 [Thermoleophilaceae bacterium]